MYRKFQHVIFTSLFVCVLLGCNEGKRDSNSSLEAESQIHQIETSDESAVVRATLECSELLPEIGSVARVDVRLEIKDGWHIYGLNNPSGNFWPTKIRFDLPEGVELSGELISPPPTLVPSSGGFQMVYLDEVTFVQQIERTGRDVNDKIKCSINFQACDRNTCLQPESIVGDVSIN